MYKNQKLIYVQSIYKPILDEKIMALVESGLTKHYFAKEMDKIARIANSKVSSVNVIPLSLNHLSGPLFLWILLIVICILVFFYEVVSYQKGMKLQ